MGKTWGGKRNPPPEKRHSPSRDKCPPHALVEVRTKKGEEGGDQVIYHFQTCTKCGRNFLDIERIRKK